MRRQDFNRRKPNDNRSANNQRGLLDMPPSLMNNQTSLFGGQVGFMGGNQGGNQGGMMGQGNFLCGSGGLFDGQGGLLGNQAGLFGNRGGGMMGNNPAALMATQAGLLGNQLGMLDNQGLLGMTGQELLKNQNLLGMLASGNVGGLMGSQLNGLGLGLNNFPGSVNLGGNQSDMVASLLGEAVRSNNRARSGDWTRPNSGQAGILGPPPDAKKVMPLLSDNSAVGMRPPIGNKLMSSLQNSNFGGDLNRSNNPFGGNTCDVCNWSYNSTYKKHCETLDHKKKARLVQKGCLLCKTGKFKNYPEYVKHLDSARHKQNKEQLNKDLEAKRKREEMEQSHDQTEKLPDNGSPIENGAESKTVAQGDALRDVIVLSAEDEMKMEGEAEGEFCDFTPKADSFIYDPNVAIGQEHVISVTGFFCKLCRKFYNTELAAKVNHCKSEAHFLKYQETLKLK